MLPSGTGRTRSRCWNASGTELAVVRLLIQQRSSWRNNSARALSAPSLSRAYSPAVAEASFQRSGLPANLATALHSSVAFATFALQPFGSDSRNDAIAVPLSVQAMIGKPHAR